MCKYLKIYRKSIVVILALFSSIRLYSATCYVSLDGSHESPYDTWPTAANDIQTALDAAGADGVVIVSNGHYVLTQEIQVKNATLRGFSDNSADVLIDGNGEVRCCYLMRNNSVLMNVTLTNGYIKTSFNDGGGLFMTGGLVSNCVIVNNRSIRDAGGCKLDKGTIIDSVIAYNMAEGDPAGGSGGGVYCRSGAEGGTLKNCFIHNNSSKTGGGGVYVASDQTLISACVISGNVAGASSYGGGIYVSKANLVMSNTVIQNNSAGRGAGYSVHRPETDQDIKVYNCLFAGNEAAIRGGGIYLSGNAAEQSFGEYYNCTVVGNIAPVDNQGAGGFARLVAEPSYYAVYNTVVYNNTPNDTYLDLPLLFNCCSPVLTGNGNISDEPKFVDFANGDYRLLESSPCLNAGLTQGWMAEAVDLDGRPRLDRFSGCVDIGCYEYMPVGVLFKLR